MPVIKPIFTAVASAPVATGGGYRYYSESGSNQILCSHNRRYDRGNGYNCAGSELYR